MQAETRIQKSVVAWWNYAAAGYNLDLRLLSHTPNGGKRGKVEASILKGMGVRAGFPDLLLLVPRFGKHGLLLEMKSPDGRISEHQKELMHLYVEQGYAVVVAWNVNEGIAAIVNYLKTGDPHLKA